MKNKNDRKEHEIKNNIKRFSLSSIYQFFENENMICKKA